MSKTLKAEYGDPKKPLKIGDQEIQCYVLENEKRVLVRDRMIKSLGMHGGGGKAGLHRLAQFIAGKSINPFVSKELTYSIENPVKFKPPSGGVAYGYEATILADICDVVLEARKAGALQKQQQHIADQCEALMRGFAMVGIVALVDEATGYQEVRSRNALHKLLEAYISKKLLGWAKTFPDEFYKEIFRLRGWDYYQTQKKPMLVGKLTNTIVYEKLSKNVLKELRKKNPKNEKGRRPHKMFQWLTDDIGNPHLKAHLQQVIVLMRISPNWDIFMRHLNRAFPEGQTELLLDPPSDDK